MSKRFSGVFLSSHKWIRNSRRSSFCSGWDINIALRRSLKLRNSLLFLFYPRQRLLGRGVRILNVGNMSCFGHVDGLRKFFSVALLPDESPSASDRWGNKTEWSIHDSRKFVDTSPASLSSLSKSWKKRLRSTSTKLSPLKILRIGRNSGVLSSPILFNFTLGRSLKALVFFLFGVIMVSSVASLNMFEK